LSASDTTPASTVIAPTIRQCDPSGPGVVVVFPEGYPNVDPAFARKADDDAFLPFERGYERIIALAQREAGVRVAVVPLGFQYARGKRKKKRPAHRSETGPLLFSPFGENLAVRTATRLEAIAAVDRLVATRLERHGGLPAAVAASHFEHLALGTRSAAAAAVAAAAAAGVAATAAAGACTLGLAGRAAIRATVRFVREALRCEELLFARTKGKRCVAINAVEGFVCIHGS
jgi:hypothetical protein